MFIFLIKENETLYNEKLLKLAFNVSELTFLQAKQQIIEERLQIASQRNESHAVIEVCFFIKLKIIIKIILVFFLLSIYLMILIIYKADMMNKISDVQELKLLLNGLRTDQGYGLNNDLEQVTIELKLDEVVRQHIIKLKQQSTTEPQEYDVVNESTFEQALTEAISSSGMKIQSFFFPFHSCYIFIHFFFSHVYIQNIFW